MCLRPHPGTLGRSCSTVEHGRPRVPGCRKVHFDHVTCDNEIGVTDALFYWTGIPNLIALYARPRHHGTQSGVGVRCTSLWMTPKHCIYIYTTGFDSLVPALCPDVFTEEYSVIQRHRGEQRIRFFICFWSKQRHNIIQNVTTAGKCHLASIQSSHAMARC